MATTFLGGVMALTAVFTSPLPTTMLGVLGYVAGGALASAFFTLAVVDAARIRRERAQR